MNGWILVSVNAPIFEGSWTLHPMIKYLDLRMFSNSGFGRNLKCRFDVSFLRDNVQQNFMRRTQQISEFVTEFN